MLPTTAMYTSIIVEDILQELIIRKLMEHYGCNVAAKFYCSGGKGKILNKLDNYRRAAQNSPFIVCIDLDNSPCAPNLIQQYSMQGPYANFLLRIMVREVEGWILADRTNSARLLGVAAANIPHNTEEIEDPKEFFVKLAKQGSKKTVKDLIPIGCGKVGPGYNTILGKFINNTWNPDQARLHNHSLDRAIERIKEFFNIN